MLHNSSRATTWANGTIGGDGWDDLEIEDTIDYDNLTPLYEDGPLGTWTARALIAILVFTWPLWWILGVMCTPPCIFALVGIWMYHRTSEFLDGLFR